jgi:hypothetical protein
MPCMKACAEDIRYGVFNVCMEIWSLLTMSTDMFAMFCLPSPALPSLSIHLALRFWPNSYICCAPTAVKTWVSPVRNGVRSPDRIKANAPWEW